MRYSKINSIDVSNGRGLGVSLFVQGCLKRCKNCFNKETWDYLGGNEWNEEIKEKFFELISDSMINRISILGGEPLSLPNKKEIGSLVKEIKETFPHKEIWIYTGYNYEEIEHLDYILKYIDVLVDGEYIEELKNYKLKYRGSSNQRIISVQETLKAKKIVLLNTDNEF